MINNFTYRGGGIVGVFSCMTAFVLLVFPFITASASPYVFAGGGDSASIDWTNPAEALTYVTYQALADDVTKTANTSGFVAQCFAGFSAGDDASYCFGEDALLNGGWDSYGVPGTAGDDITSTWAILNNTGTGNFEISGTNVGSTAFNGTVIGGTGNFGTTTNGGNGPLVTYVPGVGDLSVTLLLTVSSNNGDCDLQTDEVRLFFKPELTADFALTGNGVTSTTDATMICSGETVDLEIDNAPGPFPDDPEGAVPHYSYTVNDPSGQVSGLPLSGIGESGQFDAAFNNLTLTNNSGTSATVTVDVTIFYDRDNDDTIDADECEGAVQTATITVFPRAQATVSVNNGTNNTFCEDETAEFRVTGSPNSTVTYVIDPGTGTFGTDQTITLGASGTNGGVNGEAANLIDQPLAGLGGAGPVRIRLTNVAYATAPMCPRTLNFTRAITVVDTPEGDIGLTNASDAFLCFGDNTTRTIDLTFTTPSGAGDYDLIIRRVLNNGVGVNFPVTVTTTGSGAQTTGTTAIALPAANNAGSTTTFTLTSVTETNSVVSCGGTLATPGTAVQVVEDPLTTVGFDVSNGANTVTAVANGSVNLTVCDDTDVTFTAATLAVSRAGHDGLIFLDISGDNFNFFGADRVLTAAEVADLGTTLDIPNNAGAQRISLEFTPFFDVDGSGTLSAGDCLENPAFVIIDIQQGITANVTTMPAAQQNNSPTNDLVTVCSGDDVVFSINTNITTSGTANVVVANGPNQTVSIGSNGIGTFTRSGVTDPTTFTLVDVTANGCTVEFNESVDVVVGAVPTGDVAVSDNDICLDGSSAITFTATGGQTGTYNYTVVGYAPGTTMPNLLTSPLTGGASVTVDPNDFDFDTPGTYRFYLTRVEDAGSLNCGTDYTIGGNAPTASVVVEEEPALSITSNTFSGNLSSTIDVDNATPNLSDFSNEICSGDNVTLTATAQSNLTSTATGDRLYYYVSVVTDETGALSNGDAFVVPATAGNNELLNRSFINTSATNAANVSFIAIAFYGASGTTPSVADVLNNPSDYCFNNDNLQFGFAVLPTPEADFGSNQTICDNSSAVIDFTGTPFAEVTVEVLSGTTNALAADNPDGGAALQTTGDTDVITLDVTGSAFFTTGNMTEDLELRIAQVESNDGCINTDVLDVIIVVLEPNDAEFTGPLSVDGCEGTTPGLAISGTPDAVVSYRETGVTAVQTVTLDGSGNGTLITQPLITGTTTITLTSVALTTINQSGNPVTCSNAPTALNVTVNITAEEAPSGTIATVEPVCSGTERPQLTFTQTAGNQTSSGGETFTLVINGDAYTGITDGQTFNTQAASLTATTTFNLESIQETTAGSMMCFDAVNGTISSTTITVEDIPTVTGFVEFNATDVTTVTSTSNNNQTSTVCSGTEFDFDFTSTPASMMSMAGDPLAFRFQVINPGGVQVRFDNDPTTDALIFNQDDGLTLPQFRALVDASLPDGTQLINETGSPATITFIATPYYEVAPDPNATFPFFNNNNGGPGASNTCPGDPIQFSVRVIDEITADFASAPQTICEDATATIDFSGTPNIEISLFDGANIITVETDASGNASYVTGGLTVNTTYTITGFSTLPGAANQCTRTIFNGPSQMVTVTPTPTLRVDTNASDREICNDGSAATIALTSNSANARVTYSVDGGTDQTFDLNGTTGTLSVPGLTADATVTFTLVTTDPNGAPVCPATVNIPVDVVVRDLPEPTITNNGPVCAGNPVGLTLTDTGADATGPYTVVVTGPAAATYTGNPTASGNFANGRVFTGVSANTVFTQVDLSGDYTIVAIRDNGVNPTTGCAATPGAAGITTTTVVIDDEPVLNALVSSQAGVVGLSQGGINVFTTVVCNGENLDVDFQSTNPTSNSGNPLRGAFTGVSDPAGILSGYLPAENGSLDLNVLDFAQNLNNGTSAPATVSFTVTPFYDADGDEAPGGAECTGDPLSFNVTVLPTLEAALTGPAAGTEVCDGETVTYTITGTPGGEVAFTTNGLTGVNLTSPATIGTNGMVDVTGTASLSASQSSVPGSTGIDISSVALTTNVNGVNKVCSQPITTDNTISVGINQLPTGFLDLSDNGPLCAGEDVTVAFRTSFGPGSYTVTVNGTDYTVTVSSLGAPPVFVADLFTDTPAARTTYDLTKITFNGTGCVTTGSPNVDSETVRVNDVPTGTVTATDVNGTVTTATVAGATATVCTGESLNLAAAFDVGVSALTVGAANYVSVAFSGDGDYFGRGATSGQVAIPVSQFASAFSATFQNLTSATQNASLAVTYYFEENPGPNASLNVGECAGDTELLNIEIQPNPIAADVALTVCSNDAVDFDLVAAITNGVSGVSYTYTVDPSASGLTAANRTVANADNVVIPAGILTNTTASDQIVEFTVTPATGATTTMPGCTGNDFTFTLTVRPAPALSNNLGPTECSQEAIDVVLSTFGGTPAAGYNLVSVTPGTMTNFTPAAGNATVGNGLAANALQNDAFTNFTGTDQTVTYAIAPVAANGCIGDTVDVVAAINPEPFVANLRDTVCSGVRLDVDVIQELVTNQIGRPASVRITRSRLAGIANFFVLDGNDNDAQLVFDPFTGVQDPAPSADPVIRDSLINLTNGGIDLEYSIRVNNIPGCGHNEFTYTLRVVPEIEATLDVVGSNSFCTGESVTLNAGIVGGAAPANAQYTYTVLSADAGVTVDLTPSGASLNVAAGTGTVAGNATVMVTVDDPATGCTASATQVVTVGVTPADNPITGSERPCFNTFSQYLVRDRGNNYSWVLSNPDVAQIVPSPADTAFTVLFNSNAPSGPYIITLTETNPDGCENVEDIVINLVQSQRADFFFQPNSNGNPLEVAFTDNSDGTIDNYDWTFGDTGQFGTSTDENPTVVFPDNPVTPGAPYDVDVTLTVNGLCSLTPSTVTKTITVNSAVVCDNVSLSPGINFVTFNVEPTDSAVASVFNGVAGLQQVIGFNNGTPQRFSPNGDIVNTAGMVVSKGAGYVVIVSQSFTLTTCGLPIDPNFKRPLEAGVNYIGYMGDQPTTADSYFADLVQPDGSGPLLVARTFGSDLNPFSRSYFQPTSGGVNTLTTMTPGRGYLLVVTPAGAGTFLRPNNTENFEFIYGSVSGDYEPEAPIEVLNADGEVIGELVSDADGNLHATPLFGAVSRANGSYAAGLEQGEAVSFRYNGRVVEAAINFTGNWALTEVNLDFSATVSADDPTTTVVEVEVAPNPVASQATISITLDRAQPLEVLVYDANGRLVEQLFSATELNVGTTRIDWNGAGNLTPGIYSLAVWSNGKLIESATQRIVKQ